MPPTLKKCASDFFPGCGETVIAVSERIPAKASSFSLKAMTLKTEGKKSIIFFKMESAYTLIYWKDKGWFVGKLREIPGVFSQGRTLKELKDNIQDAYHLVLEAENATIPRPARSKLREIQVFL